MAAETALKQLGIPSQVDDLILHFFPAIATICVIAFLRHQRDSDMAGNLRPRHTTGLRSTFYVLRSTFDVCLASHQGSYSYSILDLTLVPDVYHEAYSLLDPIQTQGVLVNM